MAAIKIKNPDNKLEWISLYIPTPLDYVGTSGNLIIDGAKTFIKPIYGDITGNAGTASSVNWSGVQNTPTTLAGYGITDAAPAVAGGYLPLSGGTMTGLIRRDYTTTNIQPMIYALASNNDVNLLRVGYSESTTGTAKLSADYGFTLKYLGTGNGNDNKLQILADALTGTQVTAVSIQQDGTTTFNVLPKLGSSTVGATNKPVYLNSGTLSEISILNGSSDVERNLLVHSSSAIYSVPNIKANYSKNTLTITSSSGLLGEFTATRTGGSSVSLMVGTSNANHGVYSNTASKWLVYSDASGNVTLNGNANTATSAGKLLNTSAIGSLTNPVYFTANGVPVACTYLLNATVPVGTANQVLYYSAANTLATQSYTTLTSNLDVFVYHATTAASNKKGLVPAPTAGLGGLYLRSDGTWQTIATTDTNTKVTQTGGLTSAGNYELILSKSANDTTETDTVNKTSRLTYNPNTYSFTNGGCTQLYDSTNKCLKFIFD